jgi:hypothetical protein
MGRIVLETLEPRDRWAVQALLRACGEPASAARGLLTSDPTRASSIRGELLGMTDPTTRELVGLIDLRAHCPDPETLTVQLFLVSPFHVEGPVAEQAWQRLEARAAALGMRRARVEVTADSWSTLRFWQAAGFVAEPEPIRDRGRLVVVFEKPLIRCRIDGDHLLTSSP